MNFGKLFGKKDAGKKPPKQNKNEQTTLMLDQKIQEQELKLKNLETKTNALQEEAKAKLKAGDKAGAKRILGKKKENCRTNETNRRSNGNDGRTKNDVRQHLINERCHGCHQTR
jgi:hypothetical protein